jgi:hypothetical protein
MPDTVGIERVEALPAYAALVNKTQVGQLEQGLVDHAKKNAFFTDFSVFFRFFVDKEPLFCYNET